MSSNSSEVGCGSALGSFLGFLMAFFLCYYWALSVFGEERQWWHFLLAIPLALLFWALVYGGLGAVILGAVFTILSWLVAPLVALGVMLYLLAQGQYLGTSGAGLACLLASGYCQNHALREHSRAWAFNGLGALLIGLVMLVVGLFKFFVH